MGSRAQDRFGRAAVLRSLAVVVVLCCFHLCVSTQNTATVSKISIPSTCLCTVNFCLCNTGFSVVWIACNNFCCLLLLLACDICFLYSVPISNLILEVRTLQITLLLLLLKTLLLYIADESLAPSYSDVSPILPCQFSLLDPHGQRRAGRTAPERQGVPTLEGHSTAVS